MGSNGREEVSTIFIGGFPPDATPRELDNLCRFLPGFVTSNVVTTKGVTLFALFDCAPNAYTAIELLNGQLFDRSQLGGEPMRVQMARSNMRTSGSSGPGPVGGYPVAHQTAWGGAAVPHNHQPPPPTTPHPMGLDSMPSKRPRIPEDPSQIDTVASVGALEAGFDEASLRAFFQSLPGYTDFKGNSRMGGGFAKFASSAYAQQAADMAKVEGIPAEMAKSSMSIGGERPGWRPTPQPALALAPAAIYPAARGDSHGSHDGHSGGREQTPGPPAKRPRIYEDPSQVDTVASVGAQEAGYDESALRQFFQQQGGCVIFKANPRMGGGFAKFTTPDMAQLAVQVANELGIPAAMAKSSMSTA